MLVQPGEGLGRGEMGHAVEDEGNGKRERRTGQAQRISSEAGDAEFRACVRYGLRRERAPKEGARGRGGVVRLAREGTVELRRCGSDDPVVLTCRLERRRRTADGQRGARTARRPGRATVERGTSQRHERDDPDEMLRAPAAAHKDPAVRIHTAHSDTASLHPYSCSCLRPLASPLRRLLQALHQQRSRPYVSADSPDPLTPRIALLAVRAWNIIVSL